MLYKRKDIYYLGIMYMVIHYHYDRIIVITRIAGIVRIRGV